MRLREKRQRGQALVRVDAALDLQVSKQVLLRTQKQRGWVKDSYMSRPWYVLTSFFKSDKHH